MQDQQHYTVPFTMTSTTVGTSQPQPEAFSHCDVVSNAITALGNDLETLRDRLHSVLRPDVPHETTGSDESAPQMLRSPLSERLVDTHSQVCSLGRVVSDLLNRLEV